MEKASLKKNKIVCINTQIGLDPPRPVWTKYEVWIFIDTISLLLQIPALQNLYLSDALTTMTRCYWILTEKNTFLNQSVTGDGIGCWGRLQRLKLWGIYSGLWSHWHRTTVVWVVVIIYIVTSQVRGKTSVFINQQFYGWNVPGSEVQQLTRTFSTAAA